MNLSEVSTTQIAIVIAIAVMVVAGVTVWRFIRKRRTERLRTQFGGAEYARAVKEGGNRRHGGSRARRAQRTSRKSPHPTARSG